MIKNIFSLVILVFSAAFLFLYVKPLYGLVEKRRADITLLDTALGQANSVKSVIEETETILGGIKPLERTRFETFLPSSLDEIRFVNSLVSIARARSVVVENVKVEKGDTGTLGGRMEETTSGEGVQRVFSLDKEDNGPAGTVLTAGGVASEGQYAVTTAQFSFIAPYATVLLFLDDMEKSLGLININTLTLKEYAGDGGSAKNGVPRYLVTVELETYSLK